MKVSRFIAQPYLSAKNDKDVIDGKNTVIDAVFPATIADNEKLCMRMKGIEKPLVLNQTNLRVLVDAFGDDTDKWVSNKIVLRVVRVMFNGQLVDGIQVSPA